MNPGLSLEQEIGLMSESENIFSYLGFSEEIAEYLAEQIDTNKWLEVVPAVSIKRASQNLGRKGTVYYQSIETDIFTIIEQLLIKGVESGRLNQDETIAQQISVKEKYASLTGHVHNNVIFFSPSALSVESGEAIVQRDLNYMYKNGLKRLQLVHGFGASARIFEGNMLGYLLERLVFRKEHNDSSEQGVIMSVNALGTTGGTVGLVANLEQENRDIESIVNSDRYATLLYLQGRMFGFNAKAKRDDKILPEPQGREIKPIAIGHSLGGAGVLALKVLFDSAYSNLLKVIALNPAFKIEGVDPNAWYRSWQSYAINYLAPWALKRKWIPTRLKNKVIREVIKSYDPTMPEEVLNEHERVATSRDDRMSQFNNVMGGARDHYFSLEGLRALNKNLAYVLCSTGDRMVLAKLVKKICDQVRDAITYVTLPNQLFVKPEGHYLRGEQAFIQVASYV